MFRILERNIDPKSKISHYVIIVKFSFCHYPSGGSTIKLMEKKRKIKSSKSVDLI